MLTPERLPGNILESGKWALPGGFVGRDETVSQAVLRELREETGWQGEAVSLLRINSNPNRPHEDRQNIAFDFLVKPLRQIGDKDHESSKVEWISIENLISFDQFAFDHGESIKLYLKYREKPFSLPLFL
ncbi:NUDIX hydrolase [Candidatus Gottesmanbacteria bacterium]|nr:NUDIX hydrolase [Candidatus Gottesmanbacteria bacterium]